MRAFVDHIENGVARLLLGEDESSSVVFPLEFLPAETREGIVLDISFHVDKAATHASHRTVQDLMESLHRQSGERKD